MEIDLVEDLYINPVDRSELISQYKETNRIVNVEVKWKRKDGAHITIQLSGRLLMNPEGEVEGFEMIAQEVTAYRALQEKILQAQKSESLTILAGGIAHDYNNLLQGILGNASLALMDLSPYHPARESIEHVKKSSEQAAALTRQMLAYSGHGRFEVRTFDLNKLMEDMSRMIKASISKKVYLSLKLNPDVMPVRADATQIRQALMNLIINASEAIGEEEGVITVSAGVIDYDPEDVADAYMLGDLHKGEYIYFEVSDTGCGIEEETIKKIFDPFFSTKFTGRGLGLAAVAGIIKGHNGAIRVESEPGRGASIRIILPPAEELPGEKPDTPESAQEWKGSGTILIVDDEEMVRGVAVKMIERMSFNTLAAANGKEAVDIFRENSDKIDMVLLDFKMPRMNGIETFEQIRRIKADTKIVLTSGFNEAEATKRFTGLNLTGFIQKPYLYDKLNDRIRQILESPS